MKVQDFFQTMLTLYIKPEQQSFPWDLFPPQNAFTSNRYLT